jgi:hypothetical protein
MIWDSTRSVPVRYENSSFVSGKLTIEFDRTKYTKISSFSHGRFLYLVRDLNPARDDVIPDYAEVKKTYLDQTIISAEQDGSYKVFGHGATSQARQTENCSRVGLTCESGSGTDTECDAGKCLRGHVIRSGKKWQFIGADESSYYMFAEDGKLTLRHLHNTVSRHTTIYTPPNTYLDPNFIRSSVPSHNSGIDDSKDKFCRKYLNMEGVVEDNVKSDLSDLGQPWLDLAYSIIDSARATYVSNIAFLKKVYDDLSSLFSKAIQETSSSFKPSRLTEYSSSMARPIYNRLPSSSGAYYSDSGDTVAKWLVAGGDEELSVAKDRISNFYSDYLDPDTCYPTYLDWLAQHIGLFGVLWDLQWTVPVKRAMIKNAFGWWDREFDGSNHKSKILGEFPFNSSSMWGTEDTYKYYNSSEIGKIVVDGTEIVKSDRFVINVINTTTHTLNLDTAPVIVFNKADWNGLIEAKGSILCFAFLVSVFGLKSHDSRELEVVDKAKNLVKVRSGLRESESDAAPLMPFKLNHIQVGGESDLDSRNMVNQLVCGISRVCDNPADKTVILRVPFYYNRGGRSWNKAQYIADAWMPNNINCRVQYGYLAAGLWAVGDAFFKPEIVDI